MTRRPPTESNIFDWWIETAWDSELIEPVAGTISGA